LVSVWNFTETELTMILAIWIRFAEQFRKMTTCSVRKHYRRRINPNSGRETHARRRFRQSICALLILYEHLLKISRVRRIAFETSVFGVYAFVNGFAWKKPWKSGTASTRARFVVDESHATFTASDVRDVYTVRTYAAAADIVSNDGRNQAGRAAERTEYIYTRRRPTSARPLCSMRYSRVPPRRVNTTSSWRLKT